MDRIDYPVDAYLTGGETITAAAALVDSLESRIQNGTVSAEDPDVEEIRDAIDTFSGIGFGSRIRRFLGRLGQ